MLCYAATLAYTTLLYPCPTATFRWRWGADRIVRTARYAEHPLQPDKLCELGYIDSPPQRVRHDGALTTRYAFHTAIWPHSVHCTLGFPHSPTNLANYLRSIHVPPTILTDDGNPSSCLADW